MTIAKKGNHLQPNLEDAITLYQENQFTQAYELFYPLATYERDAEAQYYLGMMYFEGEGVEKDIDKAQQLWKKAARSRHRDAAYRLSEIVTSTKTMF